MGTVLFTDNGILMFVITTGAIALMLMLAVLGPKHRTRSDIEYQWLPAGFSVDQINRQLGNKTDDAEPNEWNLLLNQFRALVRKGSDSGEIIFDDPFRHRFSRVITQAAGWRRVGRQGTTFYGGRGQK